MNPTIAPHLKKEIKQIWLTEVFSKISHQGTTYFGNHNRPNLVQLSEIVKLLVVNVKESIDNKEWK